MRYLLVSILVVGGLASCSSSPELPLCDRDTLIRGWGDYKDGRWEHYSCGVSASDIPSYEQVLDLKKLAQCPEVERDASGDIAVFYNGITYGVDPVGESGHHLMEVNEFINACLR